MASVLTYTHTVPMLNLNPRLQDDARAVLQLMEELGGVDVVVSDQSRLAKVAARLGAGEQLVLRKVGVRSCRG